MQFTEVQIDQLKEMGVGIVYLFGSTAERTASTLSDVDIGIVFKNSTFDRSSVYQSLYDLLTNLFPGKIVDIVFLQKTNLELRGDAIRHGIVLYESSSEERALFEETTMLEIADFAPLKREIDDAVLART